MTHLGLFEGIGGFSLAARLMGWHTVAWCEWNEFGQKVLRHHFPEAIGHGDITKTDFTPYANTIDILTGGFPCQPYSHAGKRKGKEDERHLWPEMLRAIGEIQPSWVVGENVLGLVNWSGGLVFHEVQTDLEAAGYEVWPYVLPACAKNAPHRRERVWFIAYSSSFQRNKEREEGQQRTFRGESCSIINRAGAQRITSDTELWGCEKSRRASISRISNNDFQERWPQTEPLLPGGDDGLSNWVDRVKALGNAIVPQVAFEIFKAIEQYENL